jgi:hypothetical protein
MGSQPVTSAEWKSVRQRIGYEEDTAECLSYLPKSEVKRLASWRAGRPNAEFEASMTEKIEQARSAIGVCSMSSSPTVSKLWTDYADDHRGICLRFDDDIATAPHIGLAMRVSYQDERPRIEVWRKDHGYDRFIKYLLTKTRKWEYEQEWRLVDTGFTGNRAFPDSALSGVIFGSAISEADREEVIRWIENRRLRVSLFQARAKRENIQIEPYP